MLKHDELEGKIIFKFPNRIDTNASQEIDTGLKAKLQDTELPVVFDLEGVTYISSMFMRSCLSTFQKVGADKFEMKNVAPEIKKVLMIAGFDKFLQMK